MSAGENNAKEVLIKQAEYYEAKLANGSGSDPETQGKAIVLLIALIKPLVRATLVTEADLDARLIAYREACPVYSEVTKSGHAQIISKNKVGLNNMSIGTALAYLGTVAFAAKLIVFFFSPESNPTP